MPVSIFEVYHGSVYGIETKACFKRRIFVASNAIETKDNEASHLIIFCFNCIRCDENKTFKTGLIIRRLRNDGNDNATNQSLHWLIEEK